MVIDEISVWRNTLCYRKKKEKKEIQISETRCKRYIIILYLQSGKTLENMFSQPACDQAPRL